MSVEATMEFLPQEMIENICQYLTASDLASCCAVSNNWREMFGENRLWRVHCDQTLPEHLDVNRCVVEPHFTSPEAEDTSLSAIGEWRLNYMKEVHLRNNWSLGNFKKEEFYIMKDRRELFAFTFFNKHYFLIFKKKDLEVWDVKANPTFQSSVPFNINHEFHFQVFEIKGSNIFVTVEELVVRVYSLCSTTYKLELLHVFNYEMTEKCSESTEKVAQELCTSQVPDYKLAKRFVVGHFLVGAVSRLNAHKMHIWNVETGQKIKEEECSFNNQYFVPLHASEKTMNIVLEGLEETEGRFIGHWYVYSLTRLMFLPFHRVQEIDKRDVYQQANISSATISGKFIAITVGRTVTMLNYLTSEMLYTAPSYQHHSLFFRNCIMFRHGNTLSVVDPNNHSDRMCFNIDIGSHLHEAVGNLAVIAKCIFPLNSDISIKYTSFKTKDRSIPLYEVSWYDRHFINQSGTKIVVQHNNTNYNTKLIIVNFW